MSERERAACHMLHVASLVACLKCSQFLEVLAKKQLARFTVHLHCYIQRMTPMSAPLGRIFRFWQASPEQACRQWGRAQAEENEESTIAAVPFWAYCNWFLCVCYHRFAMRLPLCEGVSATLKLFVRYINTDYYTVIYCMQVHNGFNRGFDFIGIHPISDTSSCMTDSSNLWCNGIPAMWIW